MALEKEYEIFASNREKWLQEHQNEHVLIHDDTIEFYDDQDRALESAISRYKPGTFLLQQIVPEDQDTLNFFSRISFA
ncbi:MAG: hypothetical protein WD492_12625 [Alkalispirochaeta sp.]